MNAATHTDVLVVGAGPTGLMLANQLARRGVRASIIERNPGPSIETKALGVQARTLEIYAHLGIAEQAIDLGTRASAVNLWVEGRRAARVPLGDIGQDLSPYPFLLILGQDENERLLGECLRGHGIDVQWNTELVDLVQHPDHVVATLRRADGSHSQMQAGWVAGCDGPRSTVRTLTKIDFPGATYEHVFFVADTRATGSMVPGQLNVYLWRSGFHLFFPMRGADRWRIVGIVPPELRGRHDLAFEAVAPSLRREGGTALEFQACNWFSTYRIHHRRAERFRDQRCFLLGDAAHIHSPVGAQGMNTGLQDAWNLAWKLALVTARRADARLLDSYELERVPVADRLLVTTDRAFSVIVSDSWLASVFRTRVFARIVALAMGRERMRRLVFRTISQIGIRYRRSPLSQTLPGLPEDAPRAGDRFPWLKLTIDANGPAEDLFAKLDDTRFHLIVIGQPAPSAVPPEIEGLLSIHHVPDGLDNDRALERARIPKPSFWLVRPDGYVGLARARFNAAVLTRYVAQRLALRTEPLALRTEPLALRTEPLALRDVDR